MDVDCAMLDGGTTQTTEFAEAELVDVQVADSQVRLPASSVTLSSGMSTCLEPS
jgi:hypothetical protein